jgi:hypothetical protein
MMAGFSMAVVSTPIDVVKTRIMNRSAAGGPEPYRGMLDCLVKVHFVLQPLVTCSADRHQRWTARRGALHQVVTTSLTLCRLMYQTGRAEGVLGLYKGFVPTFMRLGTHTFSSEALALSRTHELMLTPSGFISSAGPHTIMAFTIYEELRRWAGIRPV